MIVGTMLVIVLLWFAISVPLTSVGAWLGGKHGVSGIYFFDWKKADLV
jgi:hypothetical protein